MVLIVANTLYLRFTAYGVRALTDSAPPKLQLYLVWLQLWRLDPDIILVKLLKRT